jgi:hypothetical protein
MEKYKINELDCDAILCRVGMKTNQLAPLFEVPLDPKNDFESILARAREGLAKLTKALHEEPPPAPAATGAPAATPAGKDKRRAPRFSRGGALPLFPYVNGQIGQVVRGQFRDASANGLGLVVPLSLAPGSQFVIRLPQKSGEPLPILYTVVRCESKSPHEHRIGAELTCVMRSQEIDQSKDAKDDGLDKIRKAILAA